MNPTRFLGKWLVLPAIIVLLASGQSRADEKEDAKKKIAELDKITGDDAVNAAALKLYRDKANTLKLLKIADDMAKLDSKQFKYNTAMILAVTARALKNDDVSLRFYRVCEKRALERNSAKQLVRALNGQISVLMKIKKYDEAEELCQKSMQAEHGEEFSGLKFAFIEPLIRAQTHGGKVDEALKFIEKLKGNGDGSWYLLQLKGWVLNQAGKQEDAAKAYLEAIDEIEKSETLKPAEQDDEADRTRYILSNVYVEMNQIDKSAEQLKLLLKKHPDHPSYNNDLGYVWADHNMNLDESEKLIRKALEEDRKRRKKVPDLAPEEDKDHAAYLDSLGWVLFKKKQYAEAKKHLEQAVKDEDEGQHAEILDHLADVHMALGEKTEAIKIWKQAMDQEAESKRDLKRRGEISKKLKAAQGK
jgi:tetratricopeptide (TPR) repeat protein